MWSRHSPGNFEARQKPFCNTVLLGEVLDKQSLPEPILTKREETNSVDLIGPCQWCWRTLLVWLRFSLENHKHLLRCPWTGLGHPGSFWLPVSCWVMISSMPLLCEAHLLQYIAFQLTGLYIFKISLVIERPRSHWHRETMRALISHFRCHIILPHEINPAIRLWLLLRTASENACLSTFRDKNLCAANESHT